MKQLLTFLCLLSIVGQSHAQVKDKVKTTFQTSREWRPTIDNRADAVMVYGVGGNPSDKSKRIPFEERVKSWKDRGYITHFMTGIAWGEYQDYFTGEWDGKAHLDEGQVTVKGDTIWHGRMVPYIVPTQNFLKYLKENHVKRVIDAGIDAIFMEEPEFWARAGYSEAFKREWKNFYGFDWRPQHESPENTYLSNKLKYWLYYNALNEVFTYAKEYGKTKGMDVKCYVPTHSLVNYSQWMIVSPEASLASLPSVDGYIAQVWTGTSREPNYFNGTEKERVFETAFLEYGSMESMTAPTGRKMFFLTDPIEDWPRDWADYKKNYQATFTAQLLYPKIADYEVMPWPERIYEGLYKTSANSDTKEHIPRHYSTQMQVMINSLNTMPQSDTKVSGSSGISVLMSNSLMFQRFPTHAGYDDPQLANFYGQALPFLKRGVPIKTVHLENVGYKEALAETKVLLMTYANMKPMEMESHQHLADWVKSGGALVYSGSDQDPFQSVQEWWNTKGNNYTSPSDHLFELMNIPVAAKEGIYKYGKGTVAIIRRDPKDFVIKADNSQQLLDVVKDLYEKQAKAGKLIFKNSFYLQRGVYDLVAVLEESISNEPYSISGNLIDLYDPQLPILKTKQVQPGEQCLFLNIDRVKDKQKPQVLAAASREYEENITANSYAYLAKSPINTTNISRVLLPQKPKSLRVNHKEVLEEKNWDPHTKTYLLGFENNPDGVSVVFQW
ncbi:hypothetical protein [Sphingobacterium pedocola]|uniref:Beta-galactosidase trimerisation domain-containing protein n=1 Tax=Sphingobacterium pedocola TaxID=2082722 RepID=A0ABR9T1J2_9SPHI|nr:hypothetical protein [Sphingobacterium pedocola]MBE8719188.1 hypothetical protein [Sphingobacterium pedocola]